MKVYQKQAMLIVLSAAISLSVNPALAKSFPSPTVVQTYSVVGMLKYAPVVNANTLYVNTDNTVYAFNVKTGSEQSDYDLSKDYGSFSAPVIVTKAGKLFLETSQKKDDQMQTGFYSLSDDGTKFGNLTVWKNFQDASARDNPWVVSPSTPILLQSGATSQVYFIGAVTIPWL